jgi:hypothetical protein
MKINAPEITSSPVRAGSFKRLPPFASDGNVVAPLGPALSTQLSLIFFAN